MEAWRNRPVGAVFSVESFGAARLSVLSKHGYGVLGPKTGRLLHGYGVSGSKTGRLLHRDGVSGPKTGRLLHRDGVRGPKRAAFFMPTACAVKTAGCFSQFLGAR